MVMGARVPLKTKLALSDLDLRKFLENVATQRELGVIEIENNEIVVPEIAEAELNLDNFFEACHMKNIDPQKALDKCTQMLWR
jgi:hypothetical protein